MSQKNLEISALYDIYFPLLSEKQRVSLEYYYNDDLSLSEIAEHVGISRQGVRDQLQHAVSQLLGYEAALGLYEKSKKADELISRLESIAEDLKDERLNAVLDGFKEINE